MPKISLLNIRMRPLRYAYIDFEDYGYRGYLPVAVLEMKMLLEGAQGLIERYQDHAVDEMITEQHTRLFLDAFDTQIVDPQWVSNATLLIALEGLRGKTLPDILFDD